MALETVNVTRTTQGVMLTVSTKEGFVMSFTLKEESAMELHKQLEARLYGG